MAVDIAQGKIRLGVDGSLSVAKPEDIDYEEKYEPTEAEQQIIDANYEAAVANYKKYLELEPNAKDKAEVENQIDNILNPPSSRNVEE